MKDVNLFVEFQHASGDFLKTLGEMSMKADAGKPVITQLKDYREQVATIELFWDVCEKIFLKYEERLNLLRLVSTNEHAKAVILRNELRETYNEMYRVRAKIPDTVLKLMKNTTLPKAEDFDDDVTLKSKNGEKA